MATLGHAVKFTVGDQMFIMSLNHIRSIEPYVLTEKAAAGSNLVLGKSRIRNEEVDVLDLEAFLFKKSHQETEQSRLLFVSTDQVKSAIAVTNGEIVNGSDVTLQNMGLAGTKGNEFITNVVLLDENLIPVIDPTKLIQTMQLVAS